MMLLPVIVNVLYSEISRSSGCILPLFAAAGCALPRVIAENLFQVAVGGNIVGGDDFLPHNDVVALVESKVFALAFGIAPPALLDQVPGKTVVEVKVAGFLRMADRRAGILERQV